MKNYSYIGLRYRSLSVKVRKCTPTKHYSKRKSLMFFLSAENMFFLSLQLLPTTGGITDLNYRYSMRESTDFHSLQLAKKEAMN